MSTLKDLKGKRQCRDKGTRNALGHQGQSLSRQEAGEGNREEVTSEQVLTNRDAERGWAGCFPGEGGSMHWTWVIERLEINGNVVHDLGPLPPYSSRCTKKMACGIMSK